MSRPLLRLRNVNLHFDTNIYRSVTWREAFVRFLKREQIGQRERLHVCKNISFDLYPGERVALVGVNGVGKTSLSRCIAGFYRASSGQIERNGKIRALFDATTFVQMELTGRENAWLLASLLYPREDVKALVDEALEFSELGKFLDVPIRTYSKGMLARLGLSLSALKGSDVLILDEVFDGADQFFREKISLRMQQVVRQSGAVIFISHSEEQIRRVCNRLLLLRDGAIVFDGGVEQGLQLFQGLKRPKGLPDNVLSNLTFENASR